MTTRVQSFTDESAIPLRGPVSGFRHWRIADGMLRSRHTDTAWASRLHRAACHPQCVDDFVRSPHSAPDVGCQCGISVLYAPPEDAYRVDFRAVSGIVTVWGNVVVHAEGMRTEYARVEALALYPRWTRRQRDAVMNVAADLQVHVLDVAELEAAAPGYAAPLPPSLRPAVPHPRRMRVPGRRRSTSAARRVVVGV